MRLLHRVSRLPSATAIAVADHFGGLAKLQRATVDDLMAVDGVDEATARAIRDTLSRVTEIDDPRPVQLNLLVGPHGEPVAVSPGRPDCSSSLTLPSPRGRPPNRSTCVR